MSTITDLDALVPSDKTVKFGGREYTVPGDMPLETYLRVQKVNQLQEANADQEVILNEMVSAVRDLLCWNIPDHITDVPASVDAQIRRLGLGTVVNLLGTIYTDDEDDAEADALPPAQDSSTKTTST